MRGRLRILILCILLINSVAFAISIPRVLDFTFRLVSNIINTYIQITTWMSNWFSQIIEMFIPLRATNVTLRSPSSSSAANQRSTTNLNWNATVNTAQNLNPTVKTETSWSNPQRQTPFPNLHPKDLPSNPSNNSNTQLNNPSLDKMPARYSSRGIWNVFKYKEGDREEVLLWPFLNSISNLNVPNFAPPPIYLLPAIGASSFIGVKNLLLREDEERKRKASSSKSKTLEGSNGSLMRFGSGWESVVSWMWEKLRGAGNFIEEKIAKPIKGRLDSLVANLSGAVRSVYSFGEDFIGFWRGIVADPISSIRRAGSAAGGFLKTIAIGARNLVKDPLGSLTWVKDKLWENRDKVMGGIIIGGAIAATIVTFGYAGIVLPTALTYGLAIAGGAATVYYVSKQYGEDLMEIDKKVRRWGLDPSTLPLCVMTPLGCLASVEFDGDEIRNASRNLEAVGEKMIVDAATTGGILLATNLGLRIATTHANRDLRITLESYTPKSGAYLQRLTKNGVIKKIKEENLKLILKEKINRWMGKALGHGRTKIEEIKIIPNSDDFVAAIGRAGAVYEVDGVKKVLEKNSIIIPAKVRGKPNRWIIKYRDEIIEHEMGDHLASITGKLGKALSIAERRGLCTPCLQHEEDALLRDVLVHFIFGDTHSLQLSKGRGKLDFWTKRVRNFLKDAKGARPRERAIILAYAEYLSRRIGDPSLLTKIRRQVTSPALRRAIREYIEFFEEIGQLIELPREVGDERTLSMLGVPLKEMISGEKDGVENAR